MKRRIATLVAASLFAGAAMTAVAADKDKDDSNRMVCKRVKETGSHFSKRVCLPKARWDEMRKDVEDDIQGANPTASPAVPG